MSTRTDSSITLGRLVGAPVRVGPGALLIAALLAVQLAGQWASTSSAVVAYVAAAATAALFLASILAHEVGHAVLARRAGIGVKEIRLWFLGGSAALERPAPDAKSEMKIAAAGPLVSLLVGASAIGAGFFGRWLGAPIVFSQAMNWLGGINLILAAFNMLPGLPLDGGRVLTGWLWLRRSNRLAAVRITAVVGRVLGVVAFAFGAIQLLVFGSLAGVMTAFVGMILSQGSAAELANAELSDSLIGRRVSDVDSGQVPTVNDGVNTAAARALFPSPGNGNRLGVVVDDDGVARRLVDLIALDAAANRDGTEPVAFFGLPLTQDRVAYASETLDGVVARGVAAPFVVIDDAWQPIGIVESFDAKFTTPEGQTYSHAS